MRSGQDLRARIAAPPSQEGPWPATAFHASASQLQGLELGDHIAFEFTMAGMVAIIERIDAQ